MEKINPNSISIIYTEQLYSLLSESNQSHEVNVETAPVEASISSSNNSEEKTKVLGSGLNTILIINSESTNEFISADDKLFLTKIIEATKNKLDDCSLVNVYKSKASLSTLIKQTNATKIISFGINLFELDLRDRNPLKYELSDIGNDIMIIPADTLKEISQNKEKKTAFWFALKRLFNV